MTGVVSFSERQRRGRACLDTGWGIQLRSSQEPKLGRFSDSTRAWSDGGRFMRMDRYGIFYLVEQKFLSCLNHIVFGSSELNVRF